MFKRRILSIWNYQMKGSQIYFLAFIFYFLPTFLIDTTFSVTLGDHWLRLISYISLPLLLFKILFLDGWNKKQLFLILAIFLIGLISWRAAQDNLLLMIIPFVVGAKNVYLRDIMSWYVYLCAILMLAVAVFSLLGIIPNLIFYSDTRPTRYSLGMNYPSEIAAHYLYLTLAYCYLRFGKLKWFDYLMICVGDIACMLITNTRLDFIATIAAIPIMIIAQRAFKGDRWSQILASFWWMAVPILSIVTIFSSYFFDPNNHIFAKLNSLASGRLALGYDAFHKCQVSLFGNTIVEHSFVGTKGLQLARGVNEAGKQYFYIDSSYMRMFLLGGLLMFILIVFCFTYIAVRSTIHRTFIMSAIILIASLNFMFEPNIIKIIYDSILLSLLAKPYFYSFQEEHNNAE